MTEVSLDTLDNAEKLLAALGRLKATRAAAGGSMLADTSALTTADLDVIIAHIDSTLGDFRMPDVPM